MTFFHLARPGLFGIAVIAAFHSAAFAAGNPFPPTHVLDGHTAGVTAVAVFPDGKRAVTGSRDHTVRIWDLSKAAADRTLEGHQGTVLAVAVSPDGKRVASAGADHLVRVWDPATGDIVAMLQGHTGDVVGLAFLPDGHLLSAAGDGLRRWDIAKEETVWRTPPDAGEAFQLAVSADGKRAAYFNKSPDAGNDVWDLAANRRLARFERPGFLIPGLLLTPDGRELIGHPDKPARQLVRWEVDTGKQLPLPDGFNGEHLALSPDGALIATNRGSPIDASTEIWDTKTWRKLRTFGSGRKVVNDFVLATAFAPDGKRLLVATGFPDAKDAPPHGPLNDKVLVYDLSTLAAGDPMPETGPRAGKLSWDDLPVRVRTTAGPTLDLAALRLPPNSPVPHALAPGLDAFVVPGDIRDGARLFFHRTPGLLEEVGVNEDAYLDDVVFDAATVWVSSRKHGILLFDRDGKSLGRVAAAQGLPPAGVSLKLHPLGPGRILAAGADGAEIRAKPGTGWCAVVERADGAAPPKVNVFFRENQLPPAWTAGLRPRDAVFAPQLITEPPADAPGGKAARSVWVVCDQVPASGAPILRIDPDTLSFAAYNLEAPRRLPRTAVKISQQSPPFWIDPHTLLYRAGSTYRGTAGDTLITRTDPKPLLPAARDDAFAVPFLRVGDQVYQPGSRWHRVDPRTFEVEDIGPGLRVDGDLVVEQIRYFTSAVVGPAALVTNTGHLFPLSVDPARPLKIAATDDPPGKAKPTRRPAK